MKIKNAVKGLISKATGATEQGVRLQKELMELKMLTAKVAISNIKQGGALKNIQDAEFKVFSQFGDDGIIQYLVSRVPISRKRFIEFGVENYSESNTRFLMMNDNWQGLVIDNDAENVRYIKNDEIYWKHDLTAVCSFVTRQNIERTISDCDFSGEIGILSIDIDGNEYWIWDAIKSSTPDIVIIEYNSVFGSEKSVVIPYCADFRRTDYHYSNLYWGCSLGGLYRLAASKGYVFAGTNSSGNNAYFVRRDKADGIKPCSVRQGYTESMFRESRGADGSLTFLSGRKRLEAIKDMPVIDLESEKTLKIGELRI